MSYDPNFSKVSLLSHFDGLDGSTTLIDTSLNTKVFTTAGDARLSTVSSKFGSASLRLSGSGSCVRVNGSEDFCFGTEAFTIELQANRTGPGTQDRFLVDCNNGYSFLLRWNSSGNLQFWVKSSLKINVPFSFTTGQFFHIAVTRSGTTVRLFVNGIKIGEGTSSENIFDTSELNIGAYTTGTQDNFEGYIDELRITKGVARYISDFTPQTEAFPDTDVVPSTLVSLGVGKSFLLKEEDNWGVVPSKTEAVNLRRTNAVFDVVTELYTSSEILGENQIRQVKHGLRNAKGSIKAELSAGTYAKLIANTIASNYSHDVDVLDLSIKIEQNLTDSTTYNITRQLGSWVVDGFTAGTVVKLDGPLLSINNKLNNLYICSLTETVLTVYPLNEVELTEQPNFVYPNRCYTVGAIAYAKKTEQIDKSFSFEERDHRLGISELYSGNKVKSFEVNTEVKSVLPTIDFELIGRDLVRKEPTEYFDDSPYSTTQIVSPVCTKAFIDNSMIGIMTGLTLRVERELQPNHIVGSKQSVAISESMLNVSGAFTVYFKDASLKQRYYNETTCSLTVVFADSLAKDAQVISFCLPKVVLKSKRKNDNAGMLYDTYEFTAVLNNSDLNYLLTTIAIQDSAAAIDPDIPIEIIFPFFSLGSLQVYNAFNICDIGDSSLISYNSSGLSLSFGEQAI